MARVSRARRARVGAFHSHRAMPYAVQSVRRSALRGQRMARLTRASANGCRWRRQVDDLAVAGDRSLFVEWSAATGRRRRAPVAAVWHRTADQGPATAPPRQALMRRHRGCTLSHRSAPSRRTHNPARSATASSSAADAASSTFQPPVSAGRRTTGGSVAAGIGDPPGAGCSILAGPRRSAPVRLAGAPHFWGLDPAGDSRTGGGSG